MKNIKMEVQGKKLVITVDLEKEFGLSGSGKSVIIATTEGNQPVPGYDDVRAGINIYKSGK